MTATETFYRHLDCCQQCREEPFNLCIIGAIWIKKAVAESEQAVLAQLWSRM